MRKSQGKRLYWALFILLLIIFLGISSTIPKLQINQRALADGEEVVNDAPVEAPPAEAPPSDPPADAPPSDPPADSPPADSPPADAPPEEAPPTEVIVTDPPTDPPPTEVVVTDAPPTEEVVTDTPTDVPPTEDVPTDPPTDTPLTDTPPTDAPPTEEMMGMMGVEDDMMAMAVLSCQLDINNAGDSNPFTFTFAAINTEGMSSYDWDFGDSGTASGQSVSHTYTGVGTFTVTLNCIPTSGTTIVLTGTVIISSTVTANFTVSPGTSGFAPYAVSLTNTSTGGGLSFSWSVTGPNGYSNSSTDTNPTFTFNDPGTYTITLTATDGANQQNTRVVDVIVQAPPPIVDFTLSQTSGSPPLIIHVEGINTGGPVDTWTWDFGDGSPTSSGQIPPDHTYNAEGTYWIVLTYTGPGGNGTVSKQVGVYSLGDEVIANFTYSLEGSVPGGIKVCFANTSTGPVVTNSWDFGDGTIINDNSATVCHVYASENNFEVKLRASATDPTVFSDANQTVTVIGSPIAQIVASATNILWADTVDFDGDSLSTGEDTWEWDFNKDGIFEATGAIQNGIPFNTIGNIPVTLKVTGPGGTATAQIIIQVALRPISCDFTGALTAAPSQSTSFNGTVTGANGRTITYTWTISGPGGTSNYNTEDIASITWAAEGAYLVTFAASAPDGADCSQSKTMQVAYPPLTCDLTGNLNPAPNGNNITYTANLTGQAGRPITYTWYVNGVAQAGNSSTFVRSWTSETTEIISVDATLPNGTGCNDSETVVVSWPNLTCSITVSTSGGNNPIPTMPDQVRNYTYTANVSGLAGRTGTYTWYVDGVLQASTTNTLTLSWAWNETGPKVITYNIVSTITGSSCASSGTRTVNVNVPTLGCTLVGDLFPVLNETVTYSLSLNNLFGRTITARTWDLQEWDGVGDWATVASGTDPTITYTFNTPGKTYRLFYSLAVVDPVHNCNSSVTITAPGSGVDFICDGAPTGNLSPASASSSYTYQVEVDNTRGFNLLYTWVLIAPDNTERILTTNTSTADGFITSPAISGALLAPADNYTLRVDVTSVDQVASTHSCSSPTAALTVGTLTVDYTYTGDANAIEVGQSICLTNTSSTSHNDINALTYTWDFGTADNSLGSQTSTAQQPGCLSFPNPGTYTIRLTGTNASGLRTANKQVTFHVYGSQSIAINRSAATYAPANNMSFQAISVNVNAPYTWTFRNVTTNTNLGTRTGQNVTFNFAAAGVYEATVSANGPLGTTTATSQFELLAVDDIRAAFRPSSFGGVAPLHVCFTDRSVGNNINSWTWDFGNGQTLSYTDANIPASICTDYTDPATAYTARLTVTNTSNRTASAQNVVRTFNLVEAEATFTIHPQGNGRFCFQALIDPGISVVGWTFGDGSTGGAQEFVCYVYQASGSYLVTMHITDGTTDGEITRPVDVDLTSNNPPPVLNVTHACNADGSITFTVTNNGGGMTTPDRATMRSATNVLLQSDDYLLLGAGASKTYTVSGYYDTVTFRTLDTAAAHSGDCNEPPMLTGSASCAADGTAVFVLTNNSQDTAANQPYEVRNGSNTVVASGTITAAANGGQQTVQVSGHFEPLTFSTNGGAQGATTVVSLNTNCNQPPVLQAVASCLPDGTAVFDITNNSIHTAANQPYEIRDASNALIQSGTITAAANGGTQQLQVAGVYHTLTLSSSGTGGATTVISETSNCAEPPMLMGSASCAVDGTAVFVVLNTSADTAANQPYEIRDGANTVVDSGTITAGINGGLQEIRVSGRFEPLTFTSDGGAQGTTTVLSLNTNCNEPPVLSVTTSCLIDGTAVFTVVNDSQHTPANQPYEIRDAANTLIHSGTLTTPINGGVQQIQVSGVYHTLVLTSTLAGVPSAQISGTSNCDEPPMLTGMVWCEADGTAGFEITNNSVDTAASQPFEIRTGGTLVHSGTLNVPANGGKARITIPGVYTPLAFSTTGTQGATTVLSLSNDCDEPPQPVALAVTPTVVPTDVPPPAVSGLGGAGTPNGARKFFPAMDLTPGAPDPSLPKPEWDGIEIGGRVCETWILYHTDMTGDWEVFRLGDLPKYPTADPNLSQGEGVEVVDMAPTRSPDAEWVAFTSNRDGNWEIYFSKVDNSEIRRVTYNTTAKDIDPTWSPDGRYVAFETDRDGNWELYLLEVATGVEYRITDNPASDINASWSDDSTRIAFQSNRDGLWQIYEIDLANQRETRLSDGTGNDHDPSYSFAGDRIAFRSYRDNNPNSVIYVMNADGSDVTRISDPNGEAFNHTWYMDDSIMAYQSDLDGDNDIYVYQFEGDVTRLVTDNDIEDYAPTWLCNSPIVVFTSDVTEDPNIYNTPALPIEKPAILVDEEGNQMTFDKANDIYPENAPTEENASREGDVPPEFQSDSA